MDKNTIAALILEASIEHKKAAEAFEENDNVEDMSEMEYWKHVIAWLKRKE